MATWWGLQFLVNGRRKRKKGKYAHGGGSQGQRKFLGTSANRRWSAID
jgi:hypothetical protein